MLSFNKYLPTVRKNELTKVSQYLVSAMHSIREGMVWLIPCLMISSFVLFIASMGELFSGGRPEWVLILYRANQVIAETFPYLMTATISYLLAMHWHLPRPPIALLSIIYLVVSSASVSAENNLPTFQIITALITPIYAIPLIAWLMRYPVLHLTHSNSAGSIVRESLNLVLPAALTAMVVVGINLILFGPITRQIFASLMHFDYANDPYSFGLTFASLNSLLWFFGIHGYYALLPLVELLQEASRLSESYFLIGETAPYPMNLSFMGTFVFIGGSGATFSLALALALAILLFGKQKNIRLLAIASLPIGLINVNEIFLFGLPLILNPRLFFPFLLAPMVNVVVSLWAVESGWVAYPSVSVPFNSPIFLNAWIATSGDWNGLLLQLVNIVLGCLLYLPSVLRLNEQYGQQTIRIPSLDTMYTRRQEEAAHLQDDPIALAQKREREQLKVEQQLQMMSSKEFCLEYQPQGCHRTGQVIGCEALIRAKDQQDNILSPATFLPSLAKAGLMKEMDLWVVKQATRDVRKLTNVGVYVPVSINLTAETLMDLTVMAQIEEIIRPVAGLIHIELTEESLLADEQRLTWVFNQLHQLGVKIYIDDFGTGYSSLSYLHRFDVDGIKIDRSFVLALVSEKGRKVFANLQLVAHSLELETIIEGVETQEQLDAMGDEYPFSVQGWFYSKSLNRGDFVEFVQRRNVSKTVPVEAQ
ncbi:EAL domain-containing protein [Vibrio cholerae]|uniref:PTS sugar transporter subunit IIC/EAL domain-containing protein n=1 Tax=Vibrio cholerae TaxID=666 RepID=UPI0015E109F8|nr:EAL domain-containing protein [Vibrio cholerae]HBK7244069.1 EAL domain-containing protein [Vibrio cholerae]HCJ6872227.1 EAL domain-containing protein [Vibrio cholerae]HCJ7265349.1 EAL domain-containing protein [Vibrio cholerae]